ncbi:MAG: hypothetical protein H6523_12800 [Mycolicibacterium sp.]|nr:hypothetical protein [Mycolicibacterium sp.]
MSDLVVSSEVGRIPGVLVEVGDSLTAGTAIDHEHKLSPSLIAALWVSNVVLPGLSQASADQIYAVSDVTNQHHRNITGLDEAGAQLV